MTISLSSTITKPNPCKDGRNSCSDAELKVLLEEVLKEKNEYENADIKWIDDETVEVQNISNLTLNSFIVEAERKGKDISFTKQTIIQIA